MKEKQEEEQGCGYSSPSHQELWEADSGEGGNSCNVAMTKAVVMIVLGYSCIFCDVSAVSMIAL
jgi:hypothetical protein